MKVKMKIKCIRTYKEYGLFGIQCITFSPIEGCKASSTREEFENQLNEKEKTWQLRFPIPQPQLRNTFKNSAFTFFLFPPEDLLSSYTH